MSRTAQRAAETYDWLMRHASPSAADDADLHVLASVIALAMAEAIETGAPVTECVGLDGTGLADLVATMFPGAAAGFAPMRGLPLADRPADEDCLRDLLWHNAPPHGLVQRRLADMVARRCQRPNHLWQDLGLRNRGELSGLMRRHFAPLATRNRQDMKWKKFLYRTICRDEGYRLCVAPVCTECDDFDLCFGEEGGESLLARLRRDAIAAV